MLYKIAYFFTLKRMGCRKIPNINLEDQYSTCKNNFKLSKKKTLRIKEYFKKE